MLSATLLLLLAAAPAELTIDARPEGVQVQLDGQKKSNKSPVTVKLKPGRHLVKLTFKGDSHQEELVLKAGEKRTWQWTFEETKSGTAPTEAPEPSLDE
mgnify:CR=1 FL=1